MNRDLSPYDIRPVPGSPGMGPPKTPEEILELEMAKRMKKIWSVCTISVALGLGIPFAMSGELSNSHLERTCKITKPPNVKSAAAKSAFGLTTFIGMILCAPVCYLGAHQEYLTNMKNEPQKTPEGIFPMGSPESNQTPDTGSDKNWDAGLSQSDSTFSHLNMDTDQSNIDNLVVEEKEEVKQRSAVTYAELRRRNRENYFSNTPDNSIIPPSSSWQDSPYEDLQKPSVQESQPPPPPMPVRKTMRNKHGDEIEL